MRLHYYTADVFTDRAFGGNQLAVFPQATEISGRLIPRWRDAAIWASFSSSCALWNDMMILFLCDRFLHPA